MSIQKSLQNFDSALEKINPKLPGEIGITLGGARVTEVLGRGQFVYVRLRSNQNEVIQAFNDKVFPGYNLPVLVQWRNNRYEVIERDTQRYPQWEADNPLLARHGKTHSLNKDGGEIGSDPVWVYPYQMMPALVSPFSVGNAQNLYVNPYPVYDGTVWKYFGNTGTASVIPYRPVSGSVLVLVTIDSSTGNPELFATTGTYISPSITGTVQLTSHLPGFSQHRYIPLSYIRLQSGTSYVNWTEIYDVRQWVSTRATGTSISAAAGSDTEIQYNSGGAFAGDDTFKRQTNGAVVIGDIDPALSIEAFSLGQGADGTSIANFLETFGTGVASYIALLRARGTHDAPSALMDDDVIGRIRGRGHDGTGWASTRAELRFVADGDWSAGDHPTRIELWTCPDDSDILTLAMTIGNDGSVTLPEYGGGAITGTAAYGLAVDSAGKVIETASSSGGGAFQRILTANLTLADGESLVIAEYIDAGDYDLTLNGDAALNIL